MIDLKHRAPESCCTPHWISRFTGAYQREGQPSRMGWKVQGYASLDCRRSTENASSKPLALELSFWLLVVGVLSFCVGELRALLALRASLLLIDASLPASQEVINLPFVFRRKWHSRQCLYAIRTYYPLEGTKVYLL